MPYSNLQQPEDLRRADAAATAVWNRVRGLLPSGFDEARERDRLAHIVVGYLAIARDDDDLIDLSSARFTADLLY